MTDTRERWAVPVLKERSREPQDEPRSPAPCEERDGQTCKEAICLFRHDFPIDTTGNPLGLIPAPDP